MASNFVQNYALGSYILLVATFSKIVNSPNFYYVTNKCVGDLTNKCAITSKPLYFDTTNSFKVRKTRFWLLDFQENLKIDTWFNAFHFTKVL